ncbi:hypothetical protein [uncultured Methylibium sp.]|uniref:hypothetical protein n=1 Tax=uncultured Methylibium sp. TaxID=381093 RepID=UPI0025ECD0C4|nr:hypothetical protein [uncultured Methylibium sp.]
MDATGRTVHGVPRLCYAVLPGLPAGGNIALCVRGEEGVRLTRMDLGETQRARAIVRAFNASLGIGAAVERAMLAGCLFGWKREQLAAAPVLH